MSDSFTEVTTTSWGSRIKSAFGGILFGIILIIGGIYLLSWNEGRTIKTKRALNEGADLVIHVESTGIDPANEEKLVHVSDLATTNDLLSDTYFGISENAIHLRRDVEMYQWKESSESKTEKKLGGSEETTTEYSYSKEWSSSINNSSEFKKPEGHTNPTEFLVESRVSSAGEVTLGDYRLNTSLIAKIGGYETINIEKLNVSKIQDASISNNKIFIGKGSLEAPEVGDLRISFSLVKPKIVSIVAKQSSNTLASFYASNGKEILLLNQGNVPADQMFAQALKSNKITGYLLRLLGVVMIIIGFSLIFRPLKVLADVVPFIGSIVGFGTGILSFFLGLIIGLVTIAIAWIAFRPFIAIPLLLIALALAVLAIRRAIRIKKQGAVEK